MQGQHDSQRVLFDTIDLESLIPDDHLLQRIIERILRHLNQWDPQPDISNPSVFNNGLPGEVTLPGI